MSLHPVQKQSALTTITVLEAVEATGDSTEEKATILAALTGFRPSDIADNAFKFMDITRDVAPLKAKLRGYLRSAQAAANQASQQPGETSSIQTCVSALCCTVQLCRSACTLACTSVHDVTVCSL